MSEIQNVSSPDGSNSSKVQWWRLFIFCVPLFNGLVYYIPRILPWERTPIDMTLSFERNIPLLPWMTSIYFGCYVFWFTNLFMSTWDNKKDAYRIILSVLLGEGIAFLCFLFLPTTMVRGEVGPTGFWNFTLGFLYEVDAPDNLFPSLHCFTSWLCFIGVRVKSWVPKWYKIASCVFALAVCVSTLTVKQHVFADVVFGVVLAEICYFTACKMVAKKCK